MSIGENIKKLREERNISQYALAKMLGISQQAIDQWERSKTSPRRKTLEKISSMFNVSVDEIFNGSSNSSINKKPKDLIKLLENEEYTLNGEIVNQEDKEKIKRVIEALYWDAKEKNKRKK